MDEERVLFNQQRILDVLGLEGRCVPRVGAWGSEGHVLRERPSLRGGLARHNHVDGRGLGLKAGVVPGPGDVIADLVELGAGRGRGGEHDDAARRESWVEGLVLCRRCLGTRLGLGATAGARLGVRVALSVQTSVVFGGYGASFLCRGGGGGCGIFVILVGAACRLRRLFRCRRWYWRFGRCCS